MINAIDVPLHVFCELAPMLVIRELLREEKLVIDRALPGSTLAPAFDTQLFDLHEARMESFVEAAS